MCIRDSGNSYDIQDVDYSSGGVGYYFYGGRVEKIRWQKPTPQSVMTFTDGAGHEIPVEINPGKTYLGIVDLDMADQCIYLSLIHIYPQELAVIVDGRDVKRLPLPFDATGYEYEVREFVRTVESGALECPSLPAQATLRILRQMDKLRKDWDIRYPFE